MKKGRWLIPALLAALFLLSGCSMSEIDELYSLPQAPKEYLQLQELINSEIRSGSEYSAPTAGSLRQSIQLTDLDGDGDSEALAFLQNKAEQPEICVYHKSGGSYTAAARIVGDGSAVGRVEYQDLDGDGMMEILVSWEVNTEMRLLKAYSMKDWKPVAFLTASCADFLIGDLDTDGRPDILALNLETSGGILNMFTVDQHGEPVKKSAELSASLKTAKRFRIAAISGKVPAVFVEGQYSAEDSGELLTDIIVFSAGGLKNITLSPDTNDSAAKRAYPVYSTDINGDGSLDVPFVEKISGVGESEHYVFDWYSYSIDGNYVKCASTYHDYTDAWFFELPDEWRQNVVVRRESAAAGERALIFYSEDTESGARVELLTVYTFTGENRTERATLDSRFVLLSSGTVVYAAKLGPFAEGLGEAEIVGRFHLISSEFNTGAL